MAVHDLLSFSRWNLVVHGWFSKTGEPYDNGVTFLNVHSSQGIGEKYLGVPWSFWRKVAMDKNLQHGPIAKPRGNLDTHRMTPL